MALILVKDGIPQEVQWRYRDGPMIIGFDGRKAKPGYIPLIAATFDMRNCEGREVCLFLNIINDSDVITTNQLLRISTEANLTRKDGNKNHA